MLFQYNSINFLRPLYSPTSFRSSTMTTRTTLLFSGTPVRQETIITVGSSLLCTSCTTTSIFIKALTLGRLPTKTQDTNLTMRYGYPCRTTSRYFNTTEVLLLLLLLIWLFIYQLFFNVVIFYDLFIYLRHCKIKKNVLNCNVRQF